MIQEYGTADISGILLETYSFNLYLNYTVMHRFAILKIK